MKLPNWWPAKERFLIDTCPDALSTIPDNSVDLIPSDPPYGLKMMHVHWDVFNDIVDPQGAYQHDKGFNKLPRQNPAAMIEFFVPIWKECLRILKPGAFAFVMCSPRQDVLGKQITALELAGFNVGFTSMYWTYSQGFPKAQDIGKSLDRRQCVKDLTASLGRKPTKDEFEAAWSTYRAVIGPAVNPDGRMQANEPSGQKARSEALFGGGITKNARFDTAPVTEEAKALGGSYAGFQPKPAVEIILVAMKPLDRNTYIDQALANNKGITWLDDCRLPYIQDEDAYEKSVQRTSTPRRDIRGSNYNSKDNDKNAMFESGVSPRGRFPANLLVSDDALNDGQNDNKGGDIPNENIMTNAVYGKYDKPRTWVAYGDSGSFSRYFDLDAWWSRYLQELPEPIRKTLPFLIVPKPSMSEKNQGLPPGMTNPHISVKPVKLMAYLITLGSRPGDVVLDPFVGSGTTLVAADITHRQGLGIDNDEVMRPVIKYRIKRSNYKLEEFT